MNPHEQQYFNLLLGMAVDRFCERIIQRNEGAQKAWNGFAQILKVREFG